jgi:class 3 adenylate cyclase/cytochrome c-type biogenesis protein CcmH/NrfG/TolB-like protein
LFLLRHLSKFQAPYTPGGTDSPEQRLSLMALSNDASSRKLAAVMFTDIKGFSKKMAQNEAAAFELLKTHDALMRVIASKHEGKVVKSIGDSFMVDFSSAVNAVKAAIDAQKRFWNFNKGKGEFDSIEVRIGIHLGDVMISGNDMYGDGVNIASRIEAITEPTRICISGDMYNQVKNKIDLKVFRMGEVRLKNIPDAVEVYEILIDSIPELATPSATAQQSLAQKPVEDSVEREKEEASSVEAAKKRGTMPVPSAQDTASKVEELYQKAEQLYNEGKIGEAERIINEVAKIDPGYHAAVERKKEEEGKERKVNDHYERAGAYLREGKFDLAENEVREIFQLYPLHVGAQQLQLQIDEERYRKTEEERQVRLDEERRVRDEQDRQIDDLTRKVEELIEKDELAEAREALQSIYKINPDFTAGERLEEKMRRSEAAKSERERQQAYLEEEKQREEALAQNQERQLEHQQRRAQHHRKKEVSGRPLNTKPILWTTLGVVLVVIAYLAYPQIKKTLFPVSASMAIIPLNGQQGGTDEMVLRTVVPTLLGQDFARVERMHVVVPTKADPANTRYAKIAADLKVRYVLHGSISMAEEGFTISWQMFDDEQDADIISEKVTSTYRGLDQTRRSIVGSVLDKLGMEKPPEEQRPSPTNVRTYQNYLNGLYYLGTYSPTGLNNAEESLQIAAAFDSLFAPAYDGLAMVRVDRYKIQASPDEALLQSAFELAQKGIKLGPGDPLGYEALGEVYFLTGRFDKADAAAQTCLSLQPGNAHCYALLARLAMVNGNYDLASSNAARAVNNLPDEPDIQITYGLALQFKGSYAEAVSAFKKSIALGLSDSLITARYLVNAWSAQETYNDVIGYYEKTITDYPDDYHAYYWVTRAYQMKPSVNDFKEWSARGRDVIDHHVEKNPDDALAHAYLSLFLSREGKADEGGAEMAKAVALAPGSTEIMYRQADMYAIQNKSSMALKVLRTALSRDFSFPEILSPDFALIRSDTAFASAITRSPESH